MQLDRKDNLVIEELLVQMDLLVLVVHQDCLELLVIRVGQVLLEVLVLVDPLDQEEILDNKALLVSLDFKGLKVQPDLLETQVILEQLEHRAQLVGAIN